MGKGSGRIPLERLAPRVRVAALSLLAVVFVTILVVGGSTAATAPPVAARASGLTPSENTTGGGDPPESSTSGGLCASGGPIILGINWNCVAVLNLTEVLLILASVGIVAYVFKDSDRAELPGEAVHVPVTVPEEETYQRDRERGVPYKPTTSPEEGEKT